ncbi:glutathione S-transferase family protein [Sphingobacterium pedocola]|uniref:Uncharacterized protein n=1 Tax=Sphingobacterium pedocola TaxID=2082722 RepID=A0ABR9T7C9_9SPHI|nr:hypothetical protein [Sphingobacterium pedocola]MBE8721261.1 hypothetical protein [Sphingobacterium pedocola]
MMIKIKLASLLLLAVFSTSCQQTSENKNASSGAQQTKIDSLEVEHDLQNETLTDMDSTVVSVDLSLAPKIYNAKVLSQPNPTSIHPDWEQSELGKSWSLFATKKINNKDGIFYEGDLVSPRGGKMENGPYYFIASEWE